jgi:hypothetical protein
MIERACRAVIDKRLVRLVQVVDPAASNADARHARFRERLDWQGQLNLCFAHAAQLGWFRKGGRLAEAAMASLVSRFLQGALRPPLQKPPDCCYKITDVRLDEQSHRACAAACGDAESGFMRTTGMATRQFPRLSSGRCGTRHRRPPRSRP